MLKYHSGLGDRVEVEVSVGVRLGSGMGLAVRICV